MFYNIMLGKTKQLHFQDLLFIYFELPWSYSIEMFEDQPQKRKVQLYFKNFLSLFFMITLLTGMDDCLVHFDYG